MAISQYTLLLKPRNVIFATLVALLAVCPDIVFRGNTSGNVTNITKVYCDFSHTGVCLWMNTP